MCVWGSPKNGRSPGKRSNVSSGEASASWDISFFFPFVKSREPTFLYIYIFSLSKSKESKAEKLFDQSSNFHEIIKYKVSPCLHEISLRRGSIGREYIYTDIRLDTCKHEHRVCALCSTDCHLNDLISRRIAADTSQAGTTSPCCHTLSLFPCLCSPPLATYTRPSHPSFSPSGNSRLHNYHICPPHPSSPIFSSRCHVPCCIF